MKLEGRGALDLQILGTKAAEVILIRVDALSDRDLHAEIAFADQAANTAVHNMLAVGNKQRLREVWHWGIRYALYFCAAGSILFELLPGGLLSLFNAGEEMYQIGIPALRIIALTFPFAAYTYISGYYCSGLGNAMVNMTGGMLRQVIVLVPLVWILMKMLGLGSVWYAFWIAEICAFLFCYYRVRREKAKYGI